MLFMLVDTPGPRYGGGFDPDAERERRWAPAGWRWLVPAAAKSPAPRRRRPRLTVPHIRDPASAAGGGRPAIEAAG